MGYVYKITNTVNQKSYIGISIYEPTQGRIKDHLTGRGNRVIANAVKKYGKDAFTYEILEENVFDVFLPDLEVAYIANFNTVAPDGYNLNSGGDHPKHSEETRRKMSEARKGKTPSVETRRKLSEAHKGRIFSEEHRQKLSETAKSRKGIIPSAETRQKMSKAQKGRKHSQETRRKMSKAQKGDKHPNFGRTFSDEHRHNLSKAQKGDKNPNLHPSHISARNFFFALPSDMSLKEKRNRLLDKFPNVRKDTIYKWTLKWNG